MIYAVIQGNNSLVSCLLSEIIVIVVTLPMTKDDFFAKQEKYTLSIAATAGVFVEYVKVLIVNETFPLSSRNLPKYVKARTMNETLAQSSRMLLENLHATSVSVTTSVQIPRGQHPFLGDLSVLNIYLIQHGIPSCTSVVYKNTSESEDIGPMQTPRIAPSLSTDEIHLSIPEFVAIIVIAVGLPVLIICSICIQRNIKALPQFFPHVCYSD